MLWTTDASESTAGKIIIYLFNKYDSLEINRKGKEDKKLGRRARFQATPPGEKLLHRSIALSQVVVCLQLKIDYAVIYYVLCKNLKLVTLEINFAGDLWNLEIGADLQDGSMCQAGAM